jgi:NADPH:quinone reductase-like Zn-dependent oxidoreductase
MHASIFHDFGSPEVLRYEEVPAPLPRHGELLIEVRAAALNHLDLWVRRGLPIETTMPHIGGSDFAGVVVGGEDASGDLPIGTRVVVNPTLSCGKCRDCHRGEISLCPDFRLLGEHTNGGFAQFAVAPLSGIYPIPDAMSFESAACLPVSYQTAWRAIVSRAAVRPGEEVLVIGASGGTAIAAIQIALLAGARVHAVTSGSESVQRLLALGAAFVYNRDEVDFSKAVFQQTGRRGVDVVIENVGTATWTGSVRALAPGGRLVTFGATSGHEVQIDLRRLFWRQLQLIGSTMAARHEFEAMLRAACAGLFEPVIDTIMPLSEARAAHERLEAGAQFGKIVLVP